MKKRLTQSEEFQIMKLVLDKFLWLGFVIMAYGLWVMATPARTFSEGFVYIIAGIVILVIFMAIIVKEYEIIK